MGKQNIKKIREKQHIESDFQAVQSDLSEPHQSEFLCYYSPALTGKFPQ